MTSDEINALPERVRRYIHDLETRCDPAGDVAALAAARENAAALARELADVKTLDNLPAYSMASIRPGGELVRVCDVVARGPEYARFTGVTPEEARAKAADWARSQPSSPAPTPAAPIDDED